MTCLDLGKYWKFLKRIPHYNSPVQMKTQTFAWELNPKLILKKPVIKIPRFKLCSVDNGAWLNVCFHRARIVSLSAACQFLFHAEKPRYNKIINRILPSKSYFRPAHMNTTYFNYFSFFSFLSKSKITFDQNRLKMFKATLRNILVDLAMWPQQQKYSSKKQILTKKTNTKLGCKLEMWKWKRV